MPVSVWRETIEHYYPNTGWVALRSQTLEALQREKLDRGLADARRVRRGAAGGGARCLTRSSSWSTRCCTRATRCIRTRRGRPRTRPRRRSGSSIRRSTRRRSPAPSTTSSCAACSRRPPDAVLSAEVRFLAAERRAPPGRRRGGVDAGRGDGRRARRRAGGKEALGRGRARRAAAGRRAQPRRAQPLARRRVRGRAPGREPHAWSRSGLDRAGALARSLLSTHPIVRVRRRPVRLARSSARARASTPSRCSPAPPTTRWSARRSCSPTIRRSRPRAAAACSTRPRSRRRCCCTCTRSATPSARRSSAQDPAVREMVARAAAATPAGDHRAARPRHAARPADRPSRRSSRRA